MSRSSVRRNTLVVAGGGTGGHFFCGLAFAQKFLTKFPQSEVLFIGVRRGIEGRFKFTDKRMRVEFVYALGFKNVGLAQKVSALFAFFFGIFIAGSKLIKAKPRYVVGVGGYSSASTMIAAWFLKPFLNFKVYLLEQNSVPGLTNRFLSKLIPAYAPFSSSGFKTLELPLRDEIEQLVQDAKPVEWPPKSILVIGGSQGATGLNKAWIRVLEFMKNNYPQLKIVHQTGEGSYENMRAAYQEFQIPAESFAFSNELGKYIGQADLVISRAGALSIFELIAFGRPTVFVPFPGAADNHQFKNAEAVQHASWVIPEGSLTSDALRRVLEAKTPLIPVQKQKPMTSWRSLLQ
jgi:UDP-N-acetylglucosamine--N-acetylmuramyl-(pentapeptide) pyrophosphoryl-undecaprenol N-acetylglucosamine transferase